MTDDGDLSGAGESTDDTDDTDDALCAAAHEVLAAGPLPLADLVARLRVVGALDEVLDEVVDDAEGDDVEDAELAAWVADELRWCDDVWETPGDVYASTSALLDGAVFTHRLTEEEAASGLVAADPDLVTLDFDLEADVIELVDGGVLAFSSAGRRRRGEDDTVAVGPDGWLAGFAAGELIAFRREGARVRVEPVAGSAAFGAVSDGAGSGEASSDDEARAVAALRQASEARLEPGTGGESPPIVLDALAADPGILRQPLRPLGELLEAAGLERRGFSWGRAGTEWQEGWRLARARRRAELYARYRFDPCCARAFAAVERAYEAYTGDAGDGGDGEGDVDPRQILAHLGHGDVAMAFAGWVLGDLPTAVIDERLAGFGLAVADAVGGRRAAPGRLLAALALERSDAVLEAERQLRQALRDDPGFGPAARSLARVEVDRGDLERAARLLRHPDVQALEAAAGLDDLARSVAGWGAGAAVASFAGVGRNEPCPCGSGKKFKACCGRAGGGGAAAASAPLAARTVVLHRKLADFVRQPQWADRLVDLARHAAAAGAGDLDGDELSDDDDGGRMGVVHQFIESGLALDLLVHEGGAGRHYLTARGPLLPPDEHALLAGALDDPRRLWEIVEVEEGASLTLRDTGSGDVVVVAERAGSIGRRPGELVLARVVRGIDAGGGRTEAQLFGIPVQVSLRTRAAALSLVDAGPDAYDLAAFYGWSSAPPALTNREGEPLVLRAATFAVPAGGVDALAAFLDAALDRSDGGEGGSWVERVRVDGDDVVRGRVVLDAGAATVGVEANSDARFERLAALVLAGAPGASVVSEQRLTADDLRRATGLDAAGGAAAGSAGSSGSSGSGPLDDAVRAALDEVVREKEQAWLDESIPALGGLTPRQAADDPTRREDLRSLLRELEETTAALAGTGGVGFDAGRLRAALGLDA